MRQQVRSFQLPPVRILLALAFAALFFFGPGLDAMAYESLPSAIPDFPSIIQPHADRLAKLESDKEALALFVTTIGPALQLSDAFSRPWAPVPCRARLPKSCWCRT